MQNYTNVDQYLANFNGELRGRLDKIREVIKSTVPPDTVEKISYGIPTYSLNGNLVHFGGYERHIGLYPGSVPISELKKRLEGYKTSKGTVQFPNDKPLPLGLITDIVSLCVERNKH